MDKIKLYDKTFRPYLRYSDFEKDIQRVADKINSDYKDSEDIPVIICTLNGALPFTADILNRLDFNCELSSIKVSSYNGTETSGVVMVKQPLVADIKGRNVIVMEDIVDTGYTIRFLVDFLYRQGASDVKICTLFFKPESYKFAEELKVDYICRDIQNQFIVGFGLDYNEIGRNSKDIYILDE